MSRSDAPLRVSYQRAEGSCSHIAAQRRHAGRSRARIAPGGNDDA
jgi:hypothetical protein